MIISDDIVVPMAIKRKFICLTAKFRREITLRALFKSCRSFANE